MELDREFSGGGFGIVVGVVMRLRFRAGNGVGNWSFEVGRLTYRDV